MAKETDLPEVSLEVKGFKAGGIAAGIKKNGRPDLAIIMSDTPAQAAALFTKNEVKAAPVVLGMKTMKKGVLRGVIINSGNANACTGKEGYRNAVEMAALAEKATGSPKGSFLVSSTGVIGVPLPIEKVREGVPALVASLTEGGLHAATEAIMTTDAFPKKASAKVKSGSREISIAGIAKGAGMICPNMATMLAYILTDANIKAPVLKKALKEAVEVSFNSIVVDNDTSTNDTVLALANGASEAPELKPGTPSFKRFQKALNEVAQKLAQYIVRDGEGATRFIEIEVKNAATAGQAKKAGQTIATSMLVKTAFFGGDPNWGRIMGALGRAGIRLKEDKTDIFFNGVQVVKSGLDTGKEKEAAAAIKTKDVLVSIDLKVGKSSWSIWTTDLNHEYVTINSAYRT